MKKHFVMLVVCFVAILFLGGCVLNTEGVNIKKTTIDTSSDAEVPAVMAPTN